MADRVWPTVLVPSSEEWRPNVGDVRSGGRSLSNQEQLVEGPTGYCTARLTIPCRTRDQVLAMRTVLALGRTQRWIVGPVEVTRAPWWVDQYGTPISYGLGRRNAAIDPAYETHPDTSSQLDFKVGADTALNATRVTVQRNRGGLLSPGQMFSVANRLHIAVDLLTSDPVDPATGLAVAGAIDIGFRPWSRAPWPVGTVIEFGTPRATMRLASADTGALDLQLSRTGIVTLDLVEAF